MVEPQQTLKPQRLESLDNFRGITIAGMVLVNNPGTWSAMYGPLQHAQWDGCTPTDLIFPFFLFIVGVAMTFSFDRRLAQGGHRWSLFAGVVRRSILLFLLGLILTGFPNFRMIGPYLLMIAGLTLMYRQEPIFTMPSEEKEKALKIGGFVVTAISILWFVLDLRHFAGPNLLSSWSAMFPTEPLENGRYIRIPGVLQRIALCFFASALIIMFFKTMGRIAWTVALLLGYWAIMVFLEAPDGFTVASAGGKVDATPDAPFPGHLNDWVDVKLLGSHLYSMRPDPEGLLSTIPAIATVLLGVLTGTWLHQDVGQHKKWIGMLVAAVPLILLGLLWHLVFPINKKIWTSSYVVYTAGWALVFFGLCYYLNDVRGYRKWSRAFVIFGTNAILVFFGSGLLSRIMSMIRWEGDERAWNLRTWLYVNLFENPLGKGEFASAMFAVAYILLWLGLTYPLYRKKIFLKV